MHIRSFSRCSASRIPGRGEASAISNMCAYIGRAILSSIATSKSRMLKMVIGSSTRARQQRMTGDNLLTLAGTANASL